MKIEDGLVVDGLRDCLVQIMLDYRLQVKNDGLINEFTLLAGL